ncbi:ABC transporter permease [Streptomyces sp. WMMB 322]|uniref:ABC transporter permease n=1 Tax=Streptomyces sp. WMMB 322 TaxID=1286821 RepID=UPI0006E3F472|nr:ABC transporter permease [Streptomyces sp. WMMB 322]
MLSYILRRAGQTAVVLFGVSLIVFSLIHLTPGDPVDALYAGENVTAAQKDQYRKSLGLDRPLPAQYAEFAGGAVQGDLGTSVRRDVPVWSELAATLPATVELTLAALLVAVLIAVPVAVVSAQRQGSFWDRGGSAAALFGISMPSFWLGIMLILLFAVTWNVLPSSGRLDLGTGLRQMTGLVTLDALLQGNMAALRSALAHLVMPAVALGAAIAATLVRVLRSGLLEVKGQDFVEALHARGLSSHRVIRHMLRNALPATVTVMGVRIGTLLGGAIVVETVFSWPGVGRLIIEAIRARDYPVVQGSVLVLAVMFTLVNLVTDLIHAWLDPRVKRGRAAA